MFLLAGYEKRGNNKLFVVALRFTQLSLQFLIINTGLSKVTIFHYQIHTPQQMQHIRSYFEQYAFQEQELLCPTNQPNRQHLVSPISN